MVCDRVLGFGFSCCGLGNFGFLGVSGFYGLDFFIFFLDFMGHFGFVAWIW